MNNELKELYSLVNALLKARRGLKAATAAYRRTDAFRGDYGWSRQANLNQLASGVNYARTGLVAAEAAVLAQWDGMSYCSVLGTP